MAWRSGHRNRLWNKNTRVPISPGYKVLGTHSSAVVCKRLNMHRLCEKEK
jgi:hypothetical protein